MIGWVRGDRILGKYVRRVIGIVFAVLVFLIAPAKSQLNKTVALEWEFTGEQLPTHDKLNAAEPKFLDIDCVKLRDTLYSNYIKLNPGFRSFSSKASWRREWRRSFVLNSDKNFEIFNQCFFLMLSKSISDIPFESPRRILFCGVIANGIDDKELKSAKAAEELFEYAMDKRYLAFITLLNWETRTSPIKLNADVKYYLQLMIKKLWPNGNRLHVNVERYLVPDASKVLSVERRGFVERAFGRGDYKAVLATTAPCI